MSFTAGVSVFTASSILRHHKQLHYGFLGDTDAVIVLTALLCNSFPGLYQVFMADMLDFFSNFNTRTAPVNTSS